eukprot:13558574-Alexandrium_andersonii.AAC.1
MSLVVPSGPPRRRPAPDPVTWAFKHRRPESASPCGWTGTQSCAASGSPVAGRLRRPPAWSSHFTTARSRTSPLHRATA